MPVGSPYGIARRSPDHDRLGWKYRTVLDKGKERMGKVSRMVVVSKVENENFKLEARRNVHTVYGVRCNPDRYLSEVSFETTKRNGPVRWEKQTRTVFRDVGNRRRKYNPVRYMHKKSRTVVCTYFNTVRCIGP